MKKYVFITNQFKTGGVESVFLNIARNTDKEILLFPVHNSKDNYLIDSLPKNVSILQNKYLIKRNIVGLFKTIFIAYKYRKKFQSNDYRVINFSDTLTTLLFSYITSPKTFFSWVHCNPYALTNAKTYRLYWYLLKKCSKIIFISESQRDLFYKMSLSKNLCKENSLVCTNFVDISHIIKLSEEDIRLKNYFFMAARIDFRSKDYITLLKGYSLLPTKIRDKYKMVIAGNGPDIGRLKKMVENMNLTDNVMLIGNQVNPYKYMKHAKLYIHSSISEGFSMAILEALMCGCTVIASDCQVGPSEILLQGKYGYLYRPRDSKMLASKIKGALHNPIYEDEAIKRAEFITEKGKKQLRSFFDD